MNGSVAFPAGRRAARLFVVAVLAGATAGLDACGDRKEDAPPAGPATATESRPGFREFPHVVPDAVTYRRLPFVRAVELAHERRWFDDPAAYDAAVAAYEKTKAHAKRLVEDRAYRAMDGARREVDADEDFRPYVYESISAPPYLICYSDGERIDEAAIARLPLAEREKRWAEIEAKKAGWRRILAEKAAIFRQLYAEFMRRYAGPNELHDLIDEWGGRPDYPVSKRSFRDGCPLIVWIMSDRKAFSDLHEKVRRNPVAAGIAGYVGTDTGWAFLYDEGEDDRQSMIENQMHVGVHQLMHWFRRQRNEWGTPQVPQSFFGDGFAGYLGSATMDRARGLRFVGLNRQWLKALQLIQKMRQKQNQRMSVFSLKELTSFEGYASMAAWAGGHWDGWGFQAGPILFNVQSWALVYFLNEFEDHRYQKAFSTLLEDMLTYPRVAPEHYLLERFERAMQIASDDDWKRLDAEFQKYYLGTLATMDLAKIGPKPPALDDWPGYVEPDLLATGEPATAEPAMK